ncbi:MAG TPA: alpha-2-macroglobulin family protein, partial [Steroidobacteraceae bacterium]|nr:alpha-2-macroglobulin family protein [Steroidobacteraceae bacterium]
EVSERNGREMTYTLAVVDEGLLDLTSFKTPNLHEQFYKREALGISTWDLFDQVTGAYGVELERLLALGGSDTANVKNPDERKTRFPPVVTFLGPFELKAGQTRSHEIKIPQYIGAVRVMLVAGQRGAYGSAEKSVFVRQPLMLLPTLPRVLGPEEEVAVPVSVFVSDPAIKQVTLNMQADSIFEIVGDAATTVDFTRPEERLAMLRLKSKARVGRGTIKFVATSGEHRAEAQIDLEVRSPNAPTTERTQRVLEAGQEWTTDLVPHGMAGTNAVTLEISAVPPLDLERRLSFLIQYPYGCLEQTTSSVFPQLYLPTLLKLEDERKNEIQRNVQMGIQRLAGFQMPNGAFAYWPGGFYWPGAELRDNWSNSYAGHFLLEAKQLGYAVPDAMLNGWVRNQRATAQSWSEQGDADAVDQAYRLYTLALAKQPEIGAMNRLRERDSLVAPAKWMLAAAYQLAGLSDAAKALAKGTPTQATDYAARDRILGSDLRDEAIALTSLVTLGQRAAANTLADEVSHGLTSQTWYSTQSTAYALLAMAHYVGPGEIGTYTFTRGVNGKDRAVSVSAPMYSEALRPFPDRGATVKVANTSQRRLFATLSVRGIPNIGTDTAASQGLTLKVDYRDEEGKSLDPAQIPQGSDLIAQVVVTNTTQQRIDNIALAQLFPAGWEIHNERMEGGDTNGTREDGEPKPLPWWYEGSIAALASKVERVDIRDDRIYRYFSLKPQERITFTTRLNAAYRGRFYLPSVVVEAMYDASRFARTKGQWVEVEAIQ